MRDGLLLFTDEADRPARRRRITFVGTVLIATVALVWPGYVPFSGMRPLLLGLPLSMAWVVLWVLIVFAALVWLYRGERASNEAGADRPPEGKVDEDPPPGGEVS